MSSKIKKEASVCVSLLSPENTNSNSLEAALLPGLKKKKTQVDSLGRSRSGLFLKCFHFLEPSLLL